MSKLQELGGGQGYLKAGFLGFAGSGKTYTSMLLALGLRKHLKLPGAIAMFDTEAGSEYVAQIVKRETGKALLGIRSRSLGDLIDVGKECEKTGVSVLVADSMTHVWRELCDSYLKAVNDARAQKNLGPRTRMEFQDWGPIKDKFGRWTEFYLNSRLHVIVAGRAGHEYDYEDNEETGKKELIKTGVRMKTEGEFGFEPSLLVEMDRIQVRDAGKLTGRVIRQATIIKDRFAVIDGQQFENPGFDAFLPHVALLSPGAHSPVDVESRTAMDIDESGDAEFARERKARAILAEEIQGELVARWPGMTAEEKKGKAALLHDIFRTRSWTAVENMQSTQLREGLKRLRERLAETKTQEVVA